jgi:Cu+-exporting ATPase
MAEDDILRLAAAVEAGSEHPLGAAVVRAAQERGLEVPVASEVVADTGRGIRGRVAAVLPGSVGDAAAVGPGSVVDAAADAAGSTAAAHGAGGHDVRIGSRRYLEESGIDAGPALEAAAEQEDLARTALFVAVDGHVRGVLGLADTVKEYAEATVAELRRRGLHVVLLTGDNARTAEAVAAQVGIDEVRAEVLPDEKAAVVREFAAAGAVAMVGDGINDAPALATADVGIAMGTGTDVAVETADIALMHDDLRSLPRALELSRATLRTIRENLFWAFGYNVVLIPVAAGVLYPFEALPGMLRQLHPILAAVAMAFSSVSVVSNSLRLKRVRL